MAEPVAFRAAATPKAVAVVEQGQLAKLLLATPPETEA
jgi:hypothetical protein